MFGVGFFLFFLPKHLMRTHYKMLNTVNPSVNGSYPIFLTRSITPHPHGTLKSIHTAVPGDNNCSDSNSYMDEVLDF